MRILRIEQASSLAIANTMSANSYLQALLVQQDLSEQELSALRGLRDTIQNQLSVLEGCPRFYYAGSYGKRTMIRHRYDLDISIYWPSTVSYTVKGIYDAVGKVLKQHWKFVNSKTVSWELPFEGGFHIDVVPGRALDGTFKETNLFRTDTNSTLKSSLKTHIDFVRNSGRRDAIRLLKLWRERKSVPFKKSFLLEVLTIQGCYEMGFDNLEAQVQAALVHIRDTSDSELLPI
jgi:tRNA nucleotidyltransferase (CCA-adding enzyme)